MRMAIILGANQVLSHGFGIFLFSALFPFMRDALGMTHWHLAAVGIATQLAYLGGALSVGVLGRHLSAEQMVLATGIASAALLLGLSMLVQPILLIAVLSLLACSAAICWGAIVGLISQHVTADKAATYLSASGSGTAWGYGINGLILLWWIPVFGWESAWVFTACFGAVVVLLTLQMIRALPASAELRESQAYDLDSYDNASLSMRQMFRAVLSEHRACMSCLIYFLVGFTCITFTSWLNTYLDELAQREALSGSTWTILGVSGMIAGIAIGKLAEKRGHAFAVLTMSVGYAVGLAAFSFDPVQYAFVAGVGYGVMYFPVWGIISSWVAQRYSPIATMQLSGLGMVASAMGGSAGNLTAGYIQNTTGSLSLLYLILALAAVMLIVCAGLMVWHGRREEGVMQPVS